MTTPTAPLSYQASGVNIQKGNELVHTIKKLAKNTHRPGAISTIGSFNGLFELPAGYTQPVLVSSTDGVGTKLKLAAAMGIHHSIGIDLVAMCVNDVITSGATPLFFLDYYATPALDPQHAAMIIEGIVTGCQTANMTLLCGETAEMPGLYQAPDYDLAGFCVGIVEKHAMIDGPNQVQVGDTLVALASSGPHANGYSLIRTIIEASQSSLTQAFEDSTLGETLLTPTYIYTDVCQTLLSTIKPHAMAHITGGGLLENIARILPPYTKAMIDPSSWTWPPIFHWLQEKGRVTDQEMWATFNLGIGFIVCISPADLPTVLDCATTADFHAFPVGQITAGQDKAPIVSLEPI